MFSVQMLKFSVFRVIIATVQADFLRAATITVVSSGMCAATWQHSRKRTIVYLLVTVYPAFQLFIKQKIYFQVGTIILCNQKRRESDKDNNIFIGLQFQFCFINFDLESDLSSHILSEHLTSRQTVFDSKRKKTS